METPDLIITNAQIITMNPEQPRAQAVAVTGGRIVAVGTSSEIEALQGDQTEVIDLGGGVLGPGFVEPHSHLLLMGLLLSPAMTDVRSFKVPGWADIDALVREQVATTPAGQAILVYGLDTIAHGHSQPTRDELDAYTTEHPLSVIALSAHTASSNSFALEMAGMTATTPDPPGGTFGHTADGELDGVAHEATAVLPLLLPQLAAAEFDLMASLRNQAASLAEAGFTTIGELLVQAHDAPIIDAIKSMPDFPVRMRLYQGTTSDKSASFTAGGTDPMVRETGFKLWVDGSPLEGKTLQGQPYLATETMRQMGVIPGSCGGANYSADELLDVVRSYAAHGLQFACHVQGDAGVDRILDVYETVLAERGLLGTDHRWRLEHCGGMYRTQFDRAAKLGVTCSMFVQHIYYFGDVLVDDILGYQLGSHWMSLKSALDAGIRVSLHNDGYFTPPLPIGNLQTATTRVAAGSGRTLGEDQIIGIDDAMKAVTSNAAWHLFSDHEVGSIEVGKLADFVELTADPYAVAPTDLNTEVRAISTWIGGKRVDLAALRQLAETA